DAARARDARCVADDFRNCAVVATWVGRRWESCALSLDPFVSVLPAVSGCDRLGADIFASLLVAAAPERRAAAKHLAHHSTGRGDARVVVRRRNISALLLVWRCASPCRGVDDFPKSASAGAIGSGRLST